MSPATARKPSDLLNPDVDWYVWSNDGWEDAALGSVQRRIVSRGKAAAFFASETTGHFPDVRVWARYVQPLDRQDAWEYSGRDRWIDDTSYDRDIDYEQAEASCPDVPPADWNPPDDAPVWRFVHRSHPAAIPVWICGLKDDDPPPRPVTPTRAED